MRAAWCEKQGRAGEVWVVGDMPEPLAPIRRSPNSDRADSGINPGDIKMRQDSFGFGMAYPQVIPHNDGCTSFEARVVGPYLDFMRGADRDRHGRSAAYFQ